MAVLLLDEWVNVPVVVQCSQAAPEPDWKWWLTLTAGILGPLLSTAGSIYVAWRVFSWQGTKDHRAWIRDQERSEWSAILSGLTAVDLRLPHVFSNVDWDSLIEGMLQQLRDVLPAMRNAIFIAEELEKKNLIDKFREFVSDAAERISELRSLNDFLRDHPVALSVEEVAALNLVRIDKIAKRKEVYKQLHADFHNQAESIRQSARAALLAADPEGQVESQQVEAV